MERTPVLTLAETSHPPAEPADRFEALFAQFYGDLYGLIYRVLGEHMATEDVLQDTFLKLSDAPVLQQRPDPEVGAWLRHVGMNLAFNRLRGERRAQARIERVARLEGPDESASDTPGGVVARIEDRKEVRRALAELPERQRECLLLRHSGYSYAEIANTMGIAIGSVGVLLARAERGFRETYRRQTQP